LRYKTKPLEIEAVQFYDGNFGEIQRFVGKRQVDVDHWIEAFDDVRNWWVDIPTGIVAVVWVEPSKQWAGVKDGDYIVKDSNGDFYPCVNDIFEMKYEPIESGGAISSRETSNRIQQSRRFQG
jgi:hypothetical protein